jgi:hypothetical protein
VCLVVPNAVTSCNLHRFASTNEDMIASRLGLDLHSVELNREVRGKDAATDSEFEHLHGVSCDLFHHRPVSVSCCSLVIFSS